MRELYIVIAMLSLPQQRHKKSTSIVYVHAVDIKKNPNLTKLKLKKKLCLADLTSLTFC